MFIVDFEWTVSRRIVQDKHKPMPLTVGVADPYHFDTDSDPVCEKIRYGSGSRANFDTDPDPGKNDTDPDPAKKD